MCANSYLLLKASCKVAEHSRNIFRTWFFSLPSEQDAKSQRKLKQTCEGVWLSLASMWVYREWGRFNKTKSDSWWHLAKGQVAVGTKYRGNSRNKILVCSEGGQMLDQVAQRGWGVSRAQSYSNPTWMQAWVTCCSWPWSSRGGGDLKSPEVPVTSRLWFCDLKAEQWVLSTVRGQVNYSLGICLVF